MATNFSPCKGSYVLNQFPSNVMIGMNGFQVSASGAIQGHHGPLVIIGLWYSDPEHRTFNHVIWDISAVIRETTLTISDSIETGSPVKT